jgi:hypothetical protein
MCIVSGSLKEREMQQEIVLGLRELAIILFLGLAVFGLLTIASVSPNRDPWEQIPPSRWQRVISKFRGKS